MKNASKEAQKNLTKAVVSTLIYLGSAVMKELGKVLIYQSKDIEAKSKMDIAKIEEAYDTVINTTEDIK